MTDSSSPTQSPAGIEDDSILYPRYRVPGSIFPYVENLPKSPGTSSLIASNMDESAILRIPSPVDIIRRDTPPVQFSPTIYDREPVIDFQDKELRLPTPTPPPALVAAFDELPEQIPWDTIQASMREAYVNELDNGLMDCLLVQNTSEFVFFDIKYTHLGDYLGIAMARVPVQVCLMNYAGEMIYQANMTMFDPDTGKELICMYDWVNLITEYLHSGTMSRRWYNLERVKQDIETMHGYFWSRDIKRRTLEEMKDDLAKLDLKKKILFTHDGNLRPYDLLRKLCPEASLSPKLLVMSSYKMIKMLLPTMPRDLYEFVIHLIDRDSLKSGKGSKMHKHIATDDVTYVRKIFRFFLESWSYFQKVPEIGRSLENAPQMLVDVWDGFLIDSPLFEPQSESDDSEDEGISLDEVEELERRLAAVAIEQDDMKAKDESEDISERKDGYIVEKKALLGKKSSDLMDCGVAER